MSSNKGVLNLVLIGAKNSGKTVYLSSLWGKEKHFTTEDEETKLYLKDNWDDILIKGQAQATSKTFNELYFSYQHEDFGRLGIRIDDFDGSFTETSQDESTKTERQKLLDSIKKEGDNSAEGIIFLLPFEDDPTRLKEFSEEIDAFIRQARFKNHNKNPIPASIVVTKWDESDFFKCEDEKNKALDYIKSYEVLKNAVKAIKDNFEYTELIPLSSFKDHNLLAPINFSLENTFKQWFEKANELNETKDFEKLCKYLSLRWEDVKFNTKYDFKTLYENGQIELYRFLNTELEKKLTIDDKINLISKYDSFFKTREDLFEKIKSKVENEQKQHKRKKMIKIFSLGTVVAMASILVLLEENKITLEKWKDDAKLCLDIQCMVDENGKQISEELLSQSEHITQDDEVKSLKEKLILKQQYIIFNLKLETINTFEDILSLAKEKDYTLEEAKLILEKLKKIKDFNTDRLYSQYTHSYDDSLIEKVGIVKVLNEINDKHDIYKKQIKLTETISNASLDELHSLVSENWSSFDEQERDTIKSKLKDRFDSLFKDVVISKIPADLFIETANESWRNNSYKSFTNKCSLKQFDFEYDYTRHEEFHKVDKRLKDIDIVENLRTNGINNISVSVQGLEDNPIDLGCGRTLYGKERQDVILEGFSSKLSYKDGIEDCKKDTINKKDTIKFKDTITIEVREYPIAFFIERVLSNSDMIKETITFQINDLFELYGSKLVNKPVDEKKINLIFRK